MINVHFFERVYVNHHAGGLEKNTLDFRYRIIVNHHAGGLEKQEK